jgi:large subunit ribosomal protein L21
MYAIVRAGGHQEKVTVGDRIDVNRLQRKPGETVTLPVVLIVGDGGDVTADAEALASASITAEVVEHRRGKKIEILRFKNKSGYRRRQGHRQDLTRLRVTGIETGG